MYGAYDLFRSCRNISQDFLAWIVDTDSQNDVLGTTYMETRPKENLERTKLITVFSNRVIQTHIFIPRTRLKSETE
jgi:hypothetical protein